MEMLKTPAHKTFERRKDVADLVSSILENVAARGDDEIKDLCQKFEGITLENVKVSQAQIKAAYGKVAPETVDYLKKAAQQIRFFAEKQMACLSPLKTETPIEGVTLGHRLVPVDACGAYVPGGRYPLPSTALMLAIPAKVAGVKRIAACSPPSRAYGAIHPAVLVAMDIAGVDDVYCVGGAQAIAALSYGTQSVEKVDLIVGPGNKFVTEAKRQVLGEVGIDSLAGPSEVLIIADDSANPDFLAIDLLAQSEHDPNARATLATTSKALAEETLIRLGELADTLPTGKTALESWADNGSIILVDSLQEAVSLSNDMAPEHLEIHTKDDWALAEQLLHFGSLFIGEYTPVAFGDYCSGTNHTLPTLRTARYSNGLWVGTFLKTALFQHITEKGCRNLADTCMHIAGVEGLYAHQKSVELRLK